MSKQGFRPNQIWRHRHSGIEFRIGRLARRSAFGVMSLPSAGLTFNTQLLYSKVDHHWEQVACPRKKAA